MSFNTPKTPLKINIQLFVENRQRLINKLKNNFGGEFSGGIFVLLKSGKEKTRYNTDFGEIVFRQESYFFWTFGVHEPGCYGAIDINSGKSFLFPPKLAPDYAIWDGKIQNEKWFLNKYKVDQVVFHENGSKIIETLNAFNPINKLLLLRAENTDSGLVLEPPTKIPGLDKFETDTKILYPIIAELRVIKTDLEIEVLKYASKCANEAHKELMRHVKPNMFEYQMESLFRHISYYGGGCRHLGYTCIAATGCNAAILHYGHAGAPNDRQFNDGDLCLFDMGPEYNCYGSDVTCTFPANGKFTEKQKLIYNAVYRANRTVLKEAKPGIRWTEMHLLAEKIILEDLQAGGLLIGKIEEMLKKRVGAIFMPHGLGHFMGLDIHDVGGYLGDALPRSDKPGLKSLRTTRILKEKMCITIEPGCYFIDTLLDKAFADPELSKYLVKEKIEEFRGFGGVRIEDDIIILVNGNLNMNAELPRTVEEIEEFMSLNNKNCCGKQ
uniref:Xaa-Pro dipeptidase n=1 Tax=Meloidogyne incognita TaxID=6306 RepID=A0A914LLL4_MELIC